MLLVHSTHTCNHIYLLSSGPCVIYTEAGTIYKESETSTVLRHGDVVAHEGIVIIECDDRHQLEDESEQRNTCRFGKWYPGNERHLPNCIASE